MFTRIMCVRGDPANLKIVNEVLEADNKIKVLDQTLFITPNRDNITHNISNANIITDKDIEDKYPQLLRLVNVMPQWRWYYQQCLKFCAMDMLDVDKFLLHDSDCYFNIDYEPFGDNKLNFVSKKDRSWHDKPYIRGQRDVYEYLCHQHPSVEENCTTEVCPYYKETWLSLRHRLEQIHSKHWLDAVIDAIDHRWPLYYGLYEYYILINHAVSQGCNYRIIPMTWINAVHGQMIASNGYDRVTYVNTIYEVI